MTVDPPRSPSLGSSWRRPFAAADRTTLGTVLTALGGQAALVVSGVILARSLGPHARGELASLVALANASAHVVAVGLPLAFTYHAARDPTVVRSIATALRPIWAIQGLLLIAAPLAILALRDLSHEATLASLIILPSGLALLGMQYSLGLLQALRRFGLFNVLRLAPTLVYAVGVLLIFSFGQGNLLTFAIIWSAANVLGALTLVAVTRRQVPDGTQTEIALRPLLAYSTRAVLGHTSPLENFQIDQLVITALAGPTALGLYVVGMAFTNLPRFLAQSVGMVAFPKMASQRGAGVGSTRLAIDTLVFTALAVLILLIPLALFMDPLILFFFGEPFRDAVPAARILMVAAFSMSLKRVLGDLMRGGGFPLHASGAEVLSWVTYAALAATLIPRHGAAGAATALAIATSFSLALQLALAVRTWRGSNATSTPTNGTRRPFDP